MFTFDIHVPTWLQGEGGLDSRLLRPDDGKRCCLGFYLNACGLNDEALRDQRAPELIATEVSRNAQASWLLTDEYSRHSETAVDLMTENDELFDVAPFTDYVTYILEKMRHLSELFARQGIAVRWRLS